jgi:hypothetical protein
VARICTSVFARTCVYLGGETCCSSTSSPLRQAMDFLSRGHMLADVSAIIGSLDIVFGEIDR